jgi:hypothetical protein
MASLKGQNSLGLYGLMAANLAVFYGVVQHDAILAGDWTEAVRRIGEVIPAGLGLALTGVLNAQLSAETKTRIVFLRWRDPLPGSEAFTRHGLSDPRVDMAALQAAFRPLPTAPREQNALWYKMYQSVGSDPAVVQVHRAFLFTRDYACLSLFAFLVLGVAGFIQIPSRSTALAFAALLVVQFLLARRAARTHGVRFVTTVLALKSAGAAPQGGKR